MKIEYSIKEVKPNIFAVIIEDDYDRAMVFCRAQEYYESQAEEFNSQDYSIWDFMKWYSNINGSFTYPADWAGFNIPLETVVKCYQNIVDESPYDRTMRSVLFTIYSISRKLNGLNTGYIIGVKNTKGQTFKHEVCHGLYFTDKKYKQKADKITSAIKPEHYEQFKYNLTRMGYAEHVIDDEIQAYLCTNWDSPGFSVNVDKSAAHAYHKKYIKALENF